MVVYTVIHISERILYLWDAIRSNHLFTGGEEKMTETMNPFKQLGEAIKAFEDTYIFYKLRRQSTGSKILYALIVSCIACAFSFLIGGWKLSENRSIAEFIEEIPDFMYSEGNLLLDEKYEFAVEEYYVLADTDVMSWNVPGADSNLEGEAISAKLAQISKNGSVNEGFFLSRTNLIRFDNLKSSPSYSNYKWTDIFGLFHIDNLSKAEVKGGYKGVILKIYLLLFLLNIPIRGIGLFFFALLWTLVALVMNAILESEEKFTTLYWICFYIQSVLMILVALFKLFLTIKTFLLFIALLVGYIVLLTKILQNGEPGIPIEVPAYAGTTGSVILDDDFDQFMNASDTSAYGQDRQNPYGRTVQEDLFASREPKNEQPSGGFVFEPKDEQPSGGFVFEPKNEQPSAEFVYDRNTDETQDSSKTGLSLKFDK